MKQTKRGEALVGGGVFLRRGASMASVAWGARPCWCVVGVAAERRIEGGEEKSYDLLRSLPAADETKK